MKTTPCRGCGKPIMFAEIADGKRVPLDLSAPVYEVNELTLDGQTLAAWRKRTAYVSHFATCPKASDFSRGRRPSATSRNRVVPSGRDSGLESSEKNNAAERPAAQQGEPDGRERV